MDGHQRMVWTSGSFFQDGPMLSVEPSKLVVGQTEELGRLFLVVPRLLQSSSKSTDLQGIQGLSQGHVHEIGPWILLLLPRRPGGTECGS